MALLSERCAEGTPCTLSFSGGWAATAADGLGCCCESAANPQRQVRQARGLALATPYPKEAKEALLEEALLQVLELRLQVLWPLKLALGAPVAEPTLGALEFLQALGPRLRPLGQQLLQAQHAVATRKPAHAVVALSTRTCSLCTRRGRGSKHIGALSPNIRAPARQSRYCG